jgi:hypothetical protein
VERKELKDRYERIAPHLDERSKRLWCANEAIGIGWGGVSAVSKATGVSRTTISAGIKEITDRKQKSENRIRRPKPVKILENKLAYGSFSGQI